MVTFSFGVSVSLNDGNIIIEDTFNQVKSRFFYDEIFELTIIFKALANTTNIDTKLSTTVGVKVSKSKTTVALQVGSLDLKLTIGQFKALEFYLNKIISLYPMLQKESSESDTGDSVGIQLENQNTVVKENNIEKQETHKVLDSTSLDDLIGLTSSVLVLDKSKIDEKLLTQVSSIINGIIGKDYKITQTAMEVIIDGVRKMAKDPEISENAYLKPDYNESYPVVKQLWDKIVAEKVEQQKRILLSAYYIIINYIEVNEMLEQF